MPHLTLVLALLLAAQLPAERRSVAELATRLSEAIREVADRSAEVEDDAARTPAEAALSEAMSDLSARAAQLAARPDEPAFRRLATRAADVEERLAAAGPRPAQTTWDTAVRPLLSQLDASIAALAEPSRTPPPLAESTAPGE
jgi:hypothetical protein